MILILCVELKMVVVAPGPTLEVRPGEGPVETVLSEEGQQVSLYPSVSPLSNTLFSHGFTLHVHLTNVSKCIIFNLKHDSKVPSIMFSYR